MDSCNYKVLGFALLLNIILFFPSITSYAQDVPQGTGAGVEAEKLKEQIPPEKRIRKIPQKIEVEKPAAEMVEIPSLEDKKFPIKKIEVRGNTVIPDKEIRRLVAKYENTEVSLRILVELATKITDLYIRKGYITSQAIVPPQKITEGTCYIEVIEGHIADINVEGSKHFNKNLILNYLKRFKDKVLNYNQLLKQMLILNDNPDRKVTMVLLAGKQKATSDIAIKTIDSLPIHLAADFSNLGNRDSGFLRYSIELGHNNLLGKADKFKLRFFQSDTTDFRAVTTDYSLYLNSYGTKAGVNFTKVDVDLTRWEVERLGIKGRSDYYSAFVSQDLFNTGSWAGTLSLGLDIKRNLTKMINEIYSRDRLSVIKTGFRLSEADNYGNSDFENYLHCGIPNFLGSDYAHNPLASRDGAGGRFVKYQGSFTRIQHINFLKSFLIMNVEGQYTGDKLVSSEQLRIGGFYTVRGYPEGECLGNTGFFSNIELRTPAWFFPKLVIGGKDIRKLFQFTYFVDNGFVHQKRPVGDEKKNKSLCGVGVGLRFNLENNILAAADFAVPINARSSEGDRLRAHFSLTAKF